jgi:hypothetical protein
MSSWKDLRLVSLEEYSTEAEDNQIPGVQVQRGFVTNKERTIWCIRGPVNSSVRICFFFSLMLRCIVQLNNSCEDYLYEVNRGEMYKHFHLCLLSYCAPMHVSMYVPM